MGEPIEHLVGFAHDSCRITTDHPVGAVRYCDRALRSVSQSKTWHAKDGAFFLEAPRIGQNQARPAHEGDEVEIPKGIEIGEPLAMGPWISERPEL